MGAALLLAFRTPRGRVDLAELHELAIGGAALKRDQGPLVVDILRLRALPVPAAAHFAHETEPLRAAGETANERS